MESPQMYENGEYKKSLVNSVKVKTSNGLFNEGEYSELSDLTSSEISLDLQNFIDDNSSGHNFVNDNLIHDLQGLNVDKSLHMNGNHCPRGLGANPTLGTVAAHLAGNPNAMYNTLAYLPQPVHNGNQYDSRQYHERSNIKEEPHESPDGPHEYAACARINYNGYGGNMPYHTPPQTLHGVDIIKSPMKSPMSMKGALKVPKMDAKISDEYRRRRERNNIAVRKSREKAKARSRETEERVKCLSDENKKLQERCKFLLEKVSLYHSVFSSVDFQCLPEPYRTDFRNRMEVLNIQHPQQLLHGM